MDRKSFYRIATDEEINRMNPLHKIWYEKSMVPLFVMPDGEIKAQSLDGVFGGTRGATACLVTQEWLDRNRVWLNS